jgi:hypothetical protein
MFVGQLYHVLHEEIRYVLLWVPAAHIKNLFVRQ